MYTLPPEMSGVSPEEGLSASKLSQITRNARMLFSASKGSCLVLSPGAHLKTTAADDHYVFSARAQDGSGTGIRD